MDRADEVELRGLQMEDGSQVGERGLGHPGAIEGHNDAFEHAGGTKTWRRRPEMPALPR
jgi:hypothetical protein